MRRPIVRGFGPALIVMLALAGSLSRAEERRRDTPDAAYEREVGCASIAAAAVADEGTMSSLTDKDRADAGQLILITRRIALASGAAIGLSAESVTARIASGKQKLLNRLDAAGGTPRGRKDEEGQLGRVLIACSLVAAIEGKTGTR